MAENAAHPRSFGISGMAEDQVMAIGWRIPMDEWRRYEDALDRMWRWPEPAATRANPRVNLWVGEHDLILTAVLPGVAAEAVDVSVERNTVKIRATREPPTEAAGQQAHRRERWHGTVARAIELPFDVDSSRVQAELKDGMLMLYLPRPKETRPRRIEIHHA
jgi:HSP20 family protein